MVDQDLLERALRLDAESRRELRDALDDSLPVDVTTELASILDARIADADAHPESRARWGTVRDRMLAKIAQAQKSA